MPFTPARRSLAEEGRQSAELEKQDARKNVNAADLLAIADRVGSVEPGKSADLISESATSRLVWGLVSPLRFATDYPIAALPLASLQRQTSHRIKSVRSC